VVEKLRATGKAEAVGVSVNRWDLATAFAPFSKASPTPSRSSTHFRPDPEDALSHLPHEDVA